MDRITFDTLYDEWMSRNSVSATQNYDDPAFIDIVKAGADSVPFIYDRIKEHPDPIVHALDLIYPGEVKNDGFVPLADYCTTWRVVLKLHGRVPQEDK